MSDSQTFSIYNAKVVTPETTLENGYVRVENGKIAFAGLPSELSPEKRNEWDAGAIDAQGGWVIPGFIDLHVHGGYGADFMYSNKEVLDTITKFHRDHGTTAIVATTMTASREALDRVLGEVQRYMGEPMPYAQLEGVHLEGPFINVKYKGAQNPAYMIDPQLDWLQDWVAKYPGVIKQVSLAPERNGALEAIEWLRGQGINVAAAHTDASYEQIEEAVKAGLNQAVHTFNAMTPIHHRNPGTAGAVLSLDGIVAELIADCIHVHPAVMKIIAKAKTDNNLVLITDAMSAAGLGDGDYELGGLDVVVKDGQARLKEGDSLAGSTLTMINAFRNFIRHVGVTVQEAVLLTSYNAAKALGIDDRTGSIAVGKQADLLLLDEDLNLLTVWVKGRSNR